MNNRYVDKKITELDEIKKMVDASCGTKREEWESKWYKKVRDISTTIQLTKKLKNRNY